MGVHSWGFDAIIAHDAAVRGPNPHAMYGSRPESWQWMARIIDYLLAEFGFGGFHVARLEQACGSPVRVRRIAGAIRGTLADIARAR